MTQTKRDFVSESDMSDQENNGSGSNNAVLPTAEQIVQAIEMLGYQQQALWMEHQRTATNATIQSNPSGASGSGEPNPNVTAGSGTPGVAQPVPIMSAGQPMVMPGVPGVAQPMHVMNAGQPAAYGYGPMPNQMMMNPAIQPVPVAPAMPAQAGHPVPILPAPAAAGTVPGDAWENRPQGQPYPTSDHGNSNVTMTVEQYQQLCAKATTTTKKETGKDSPWPPVPSKRGYKYYYAMGPDITPGIYAGWKTMEHAFPKGMSWSTLSAGQVVGFDCLEQACGALFRGNPLKYTVTVRK